MEEKVVNYLALGAEGCYFVDHEDGTSWGGDIVDKLTKSVKDVKSSSNGWKYAKYVAMS